MSKSSKSAHATLQQGHYGAGDALHKLLLQLAKSVDETHPKTANLFKNLNVRVAKKETV